MEQEPQPPDDQTRDAIGKAAEAGSPTLSGLIQAHHASLLMMAQRLHAREAAGHSLNPTALLNEAYARLCKQPKVGAKGTLFFKACFAQECRRILVEHARKKHALRRGGDRKRETLADKSGVGTASSLDLLVVNDLIEGLARHSERMARIVDMRVFSDLTVAECAEVLGVSTRTVDKDWKFARAWLRKEMG
ncbi:MAG: hypothetical protein IPK26_29355 [Planctomycetes bacterium]|nr:hypothetical protein [Planctomycetota bacterium]